VFPRSKKLDTESELYDVALRALMRRPHSVNEMQKLLKRRASSDLLAQVVLARLKENGSLNDDRYAKQFTRQRTEIRRQGKFRIARDLRARGVPDTHIQSAIEESADDAAERAAIRHRIDRKLKLTRGPKPGEMISDKKNRLALPQPLSRRLPLRRHPPRTKIHHPRRTPRSRRPARRDIFFLATH
jgi:SOS response regulatory protein OraA/RecX